VSSDQVCKVADSSLLEFIQVSNQHGRGLFRYSVCQFGNVRKELAVGLHRMCDLPVLDDFHIQVGHSHLLAQAEVIFQGSRIHIRREFVHQALRPLHARSGKFAQDALVIQCVYESLHLYFMVFYL
jgi:hypothetical protein